MMFKPEMGGSCAAAANENAHNFLVLSRIRQKSLPVRGENLPLGLIVLTDAVHLFIIKSRKAQKNGTFLRAWWWDETED